MSSEYGNTHAWYQNEIAKLEALLDEYKDSEHRAQKFAGLLLADNQRLREALEGIAISESYVDKDGLWDERPALKKREMWNIARDALRV